MEEQLLTTDITTIDDLKKIFMQGEIELPIPIFRGYYGKDHESNAAKEIDKFFRFLEDQNLIEFIVAETFLDGLTSERSNGGRYDACNTKIMNTFNDDGFVVYLMSIEALGPSVKKRVISRHLFPFGHITFNSHCFSKL